MIAYRARTERVMGIYVNFMLLQMEKSQIRKASLTIKSFWLIVCANIPFFSSWIDFLKSSPYKFSILLAYIYLEKKAVCFWYMPSSKGEKRAKRKVRAAAEASRASNNNHIQSDQRWKRHNLNEVFTKTAKDILGFSDTKALCNVI